MAYDRKLETDHLAMVAHNESQKAAASARLKKVAAQVKAKKAAKKAVQA